MSVDVIWTKSQRSAIDTRGRNILVSAAAGSGKTAVLVERIVRRVMHDIRRTDIDNMLVVTFTNAAAAEMKDRIGKSLREYKYKCEYALSDRALRGRCRSRALRGSDDMNIRRHEQIAALDDAAICTIDSFCNDCVRSFTHELNISPDFRLCDPAEDALIIDNAADELFEECYASDTDEDFNYLTAYYGSMRGDSGLKELVVKIYRFLQSYAEPMEKLSELFRHYESCEDIFASEWARELMEEQKSAAWRLLADFGETKAEIEKGCCANAHISMIEKVIDPAMEALSKIAGADINGGAKAWDEIFNISFEFRKYPPAKPRKSTKKNADNKGVEEMQAVYKRLFDRSKELMYVMQPSQEVEAQHKAISAQALRLRNMVARLSEAVDSVKHRRGVYSFSDIEHMTYRLITYPEYAEISEIYRERFTDVMIDEYQDTNGLQDAILSGISNGRNMFMVGDLKQSIYAFRGGDPSIFKKKGEEYTPIEDADRHSAQSVRIDLSDNFRSNACVVNAVNELFGYIMTDDMGDVDYDSSGERLRCGRELSDSEEKKAVYADTKSELVYLPLTDVKSGSMNGEDAGKTGIEARYVAQRIRDMVDSHVKVVDKDTIRDIRYSDFTIIANAIKTIINIYSDALDEKGIPLGIPSIGYYDFFEVSVVLAFLKVIANRRRDVPLIAVMRSPIGGFTDEELARIAMAVKGGDFYGRMESVVRISEARLRKGEQDLPVERALLEKLKKFMALTDRFDSYKHYRSAAAMVYAVYTETGFYDFVGAMDGGKRAQQNLTLLYEKAKKFETTASGGLYGFVKYIERLRRDADKEEGAAASDGLSDSVKMMTIHGSKGLEFPVVFMVSCGKKFKNDSVEDGLLNREAGIGLRYLDAENRVRINSPIYRWVQLRSLREARSEDVRKLYVGMTRAREKLVCLMSGDDSAQKALDEGRRKGMAILSDRDSGVPPLSQLIRAKGFMGWILPAYMAGLAQNGASAWDMDSGTDARDYLSKDVYSIIRHRYRFESLTALPSKTTVSKVKEEHNREEGSTFAPRYETGLVKPMTGEEKSGVSANIIGTAYHKVMELIDPLRANSEDEVRAQVEEMCVSGQLVRETAENIEPALIVRFFDSPMGERVTEAYRAGRLFRETPFEIAIAPDEYDEGAAYYADSDKVLLQGTIDCWFEDETGRKTVIDYKTDSYKGSIDDETSKAEFAEEKAREYGIQLELYAKALRLSADNTEEAKDMEKYIYLFKTNSFKRVEDNEK